MINYDTIPNITGSFPDVVAQNTSGPSAQDGTPYLKSVIDDLWGARQALLLAAGLTPSGLTESSSVSQQLEAIQNVAGGPGEVVAWMGENSDPSALNKRLLALNGQGILRANYVDLDAACYVGDPDNPTASAFYRADDSGGSVRNTAGIYLILPDLRGYVLRGLDVAGAVDPDGASRDVGSVQNDSIIEHGHDEILASVPPYVQLVHFPISLAPTGTTYNFALGSGLPISNPHYFAGAAILTADSNPDENRMINVATRWAIRY